MNKYKLRHVVPSDAWIQRLIKANTFIYKNHTGKIIQSQKTLGRIEAMNIPPAYKEVKICPDEEGHIQAVGTDARGRKQYLYHEHWIKLQAETKFQRLYDFGRALPKIRRRVKKDLNQKTLSKEKILAAMVKIMDLTSIRVGNKAYAEDHETYGLTTLRKKHAKVKADQTLFRFKGKNETPWEVTLEDPLVSKIVKKCAEIPGHALFKYEDEAGEVRLLCSEEFNTYLSEIAEADFTAKDFRTFAACREIFKILIKAHLETKKERTKFLQGSVKIVADKMGHTTAVCKKSYIHPDLLSCFMDGDLEDWCKRQKETNDERLLLKWWKVHIKRGRV